MTDYAITIQDDLYTNYPLVASGDRFILSDLASFIIDASTVVSLNEIEFNSVFQKLILRNSSTTTPIILNMTSSGLDGANGVLELDGGLLDLGAVTGLPSQTLSFPADSNGAYPSFIGHVFIDDIKYTQITSFTGIRNDFRGYHFTYNNVTGVLTFGDGVNGVAPSGAITAENFYIECNGSSVGLTSGIVNGSGHCVFIDGNFSSDLEINVAETWAIVNNSSNFQPDDFTKHRYSGLTYMSVGASENARMILAEDTAGDNILFQTENTSSTEVFQNINVPMWGDHEARIVGQRLSNFSRVRMYNDGGDATLKIYQGRGAIFTTYGGVGGTWHIQGSDGYLTTDDSPHSAIHGRYECDQSITFEWVGGTSWSGERSGMTVYDLDAGKYKLGSIDHPVVIPADVSVDEIINTSGGVEVWVDNLQFLGQASSHTRDFNCNSPSGTLVTNFSAPNDVSHGIQPQPNVRLEAFSCIGNDPVFSRGMNSSTVVKNAARDLAQLWFMPHAHNSSGSMISGSVDNLIYVSSRVYIDGIGTKGEVLSEVIVYHGAVTLFTAKGWNTGEFAFEYKLFKQGDPEPASYQTMTAANVQADQAALVVGDKYQIRYTFEKISGTANSGYIQGLYFDMPFDPAYVWEPELEPMAVDFNGDLQAGDAIRIQNLAGGTVFYEIMTGTTKQVLISGDLDGDTLSFAADRQGSAPALGSFIVSAGTVLPVSLSIPPYLRANNSEMHSNSVDPAISVTFDLITPELRITIDNKQVEAQDVFNAVENALITEDGMTWHAQQGTIVRWDDLQQSGVQFFMQSNIRLFGIGLNAGIRGIVDAVDSEIISPGSAQVTFGSAYKEYTQEDRDRDELIKAKVDLLPDSILNRNLAGGSDGGRTVRDALRGSRNKVEINTKTNKMIVYKENDADIAWEADLQIGSRGAINTVDPS